MKQGYLTEIVNESLKLANESLTEARNPANDEINAIIRKHLEKKSPITKREQKVLDKYGIKYNEEDKTFEGPGGREVYWSNEGKYYGGKGIMGPSKLKPKEHGHYNRHTSQDSPEYEKVDYANYLLKDNDFRWDEESWRGQKTSNADKRARSENYFEIPSLRPYSDDYRAAVDNYETYKQWADEGKQDIDKARAEFEKKLEYKKDAVNRYESEANEYKKEKDDILAKARAKRASKMGESLSLNEDYNDIYQKVHKYFEDELFDIEYDSAQQVADEVFGYNSDWCEADGSAEVVKKIEDTRNAYLDALTDACFVNYDGE